MTPIASLHPGRRRAPIHLPSLLVLATLLGLSPARAADAGESDASQEVSISPRVIELNERGAEHYERGEYRRAVEKFIQAHALSPDPNLLFNIASCYEKLGDSEAAVERYRQFLVAEGADPRGRPRAMAGIERLEREQRERDARQGAPEPAPSPPESPSVVVESGFDRALPWVALGGGAALAVVGATLYALGERDHSRVTESRGFDDPSSVSSLTRARAQSLVSSGDAKKAWGVASLVAGGAVLSTYAILRFAAFGGEERAAPSVGLAAGPSGASLSLSGRF